MGLGCKLHAPAASPPVKDPATTVQVACPSSSRSVVFILITCIEKVTVSVILNIQFVVWLQLNVCQLCVLLFSYVLKMLSVLEIIQTEVYT
jgi:hypothetical protein